MTDRYAAYIVVLEDDYRDDSSAVEAIMTALRMVKGVAGVKPVIHTYDTHIAKMRADTEWLNRINRFADEARKEIR